MGWRRRSADDLSEEIRAHIAHETDRLIAEGMSPNEAALAARRKFGNVTAVTERFYESRRRLWLDELRQDFHSARRNLVRYPVVAIVAVLSLGAGIGATAASLTVRDIIFQNPPPLYVEPHQLSRIQVTRQDRPIRPIGAYVPRRSVPAMAQRDRPVDCRAVFERGVSDVRVADRVEPTADQIGHSEPLHRARRRAGDRTRVLARGQSIRSRRPFSVTGSGSNGSSDGPMRSAATIWIDNQPHTVIGVMPRRFWFSETQRSDLDAGSNPARLTADDGSAGRCAASRQARAPTRWPTTLAGVPRRVLTPARLPARARCKMRVSEIKGTPIAEQMSAILPYVLGTAVLLTLLIACANVAILMIAQWTRREAETAHAIGPGRVAVTADSGHGRRVGAAGLLRGTFSASWRPMRLRAIMLRNAPLADTFVRPVHSSGRADQIHLR